MDVYKRARPYLYPGCHRRRNRIRKATAAAAAIGALTAAITLAVQSPGPARATTAAAYRPLATPDRNVLFRPASSPLPAQWTVRAGDTLSGIAAARYHQADAWPLIYHANRGQIRWADDIYIGQVLALPGFTGYIPAPPGELAPPPPRPAYVAPVAASDSEASSYQAPVSYAAPSTYSGGVPGGSFGQCVIARESGGQAQVMNATGHYGLYQFAAGTWAAYGGNPADFGHASAAEQNQVFANALAQGGQGNWSQYDGC